MGSTAIRAGEVVDVELALGRSRSWAEITRAPEAGDAGPNEVPCVVAVVEQVYDDGVAALRIGEGLALLDIVGERPVHADGARVTIPTDELEFWPTGI